MKLANSNGRAVIVLGEEIVDVAQASEGRFGPDPMSVFAEWDPFVAFAETATKSTAPLVLSNLQNPVPRPAQVFAIGLNYNDHAAESGMAVPEAPAVFTKFPASLAGPFDEVEICGDSTDWEAELVVVIGRMANRVSTAEAWSHVAGLTIGQDISDRHLQFAAGAQFSLGKSRRGYGPMGPWLVSTEDFDHPDDLRIGCSVNGEIMQDSRTSELIIGVPQLVSELSAVLPVWPGDVIFTGTPAGVGVVRNPPVFLRHGDVLETSIEQIGSIRNVCTSPA